MYRSGSMREPTARSRRARLAIAIYVVGAVLALLMVFPIGEGESSKPARSIIERAAVFEASEPIVPKTMNQPRGALPPVTSSSETHETDENGPANDLRPTTLEGLAAHLERKFQNDASPTGIMVEAQNAFAGLFSNPDIKGAALSSVKCGATVCRAQVVFNDSTSDNDFARYAFLDPKTDLDFGLDISVPVRNVREDGSVEATIFMFKADPPPPEAAE